MPFGPLSLHSFGRSVEAQPRWGMEREGRRYRARKRTWNFSNRPEADLGRYESCITRSIAGGCIRTRFDDGNECISKRVSSVVN